MPRRRENAKMPLKWSHTTAVAREAGGGKGGKGRGQVVVVGTIIFVII